MVIHINIKSVSIFHSLGPVHEIYIKRNKPMTKIGDQCGAHGSKTLRSSSNTTHTQQPSQLASTGQPHDPELTERHHAFPVKLAAIG